MDENQMQLRDEISKKIKERDNLAKDIEEVEKLFKDVFGEYLGTHDHQYLTWVMCPNAHSSITVGFTRLQYKAGNNSGKMEYKETFAVDVSGRYNYPMQQDLPLMDDTDRRLILTHAPAIFEEYKKIIMEDFKHDEIAREQFQSFKEKVN